MTEILSVLSRYFHSRIFAGETADHKSTEPDVALGCIDKYLFADSPCIADGMLDSKISMALLSRSEITMPFKINKIACRCFLTVRIVKFRVDRQRRTTQLALKDDALVAKKAEEAIAEGSAPSGLTPSR